MTMSNDGTLGRTGLLGRCGGKNGPDAGDGDVAVEALRILIDAGKVSAEDAEAAVQSARISDDAVAEARATNEGNSGRNDKKKTKQRKSREAYRTRHVALQFSYDGTDFTGFAENVGKSCDNSVEKTLFAALEKTRLLLPPEEIGTLAAIEDEKADGQKEGEGSKNKDQPSARNASQYSRCGRTDKGVHAHGQVVALYLKSAFPLSAREVGSNGVDAEDNMVAGDFLHEDSLPKNSLNGLECLVPLKKPKSGDTKLQRKTIAEFDYPKILNNVLPPAIRVLGWCPVSPKFSARFSCSRRTYRYFFPRRSLDLSAMAKGLQHMMGRHDFRNLCKMNCEQVYNFERVLMSGKVVSPQKVFAVSVEDGEKVTSSLREADGASSMQFSPHDMCHVEIVGQAFLWHQIRCILSVLFYIGRRLEAPTLVQQLLDVQTNPAKPAYEMASETALVLQDCKFSQLSLGRTVRNLWAVTKVLEQRWETHAVAAERANDALESINNETEVRWTDVMQFVEQIGRDRRRKGDRRTSGVSGDYDYGEIRRALNERTPDRTMISWASAVKVIDDVLGVRPHLPNGTGPGQKGQTETSVHMPLMQRSKGTTYEEKVRSILGESGGVKGNNGKGSKRKERYEENVIKKRKTAEEDRAFYDHMLRQGGSSA